MPELFDKFERESDGLTVCPRSFAAGYVAGRAQDGWFYDMSKAPKNKPILVSGGNWYDPEEIGGLGCQHNEVSYARYLHNCNGYNWCVGNPRDGNHIKPIAWQDLPSSAPNP